MADDFFIKYGDLIRDDGTFQNLDKHIDNLEKRLKDLAKSQKKAFEGVSHDDIESIEKLEKAANDLLKAEKKLVEQKKVNNKVRKKTIDLTNEELVQREAEKIKQRERVQIAKQEAIILKEEKNNIASLRAQLSLATLEWKKFTAEEIKNTKEGKKAFNDKKRLTEQLKKLEKATGDNRREVGNYGLALNKLSKSANKTKKILVGLFVGRNIISGIQRIGSAFGNLVSQFRDSNSAIGGIGKSFDKVTGSLQFVGVKLLTAFAPLIEKFANFISTLPAVFAGVAAAASQLATNISSSFKKLGLNLELIFAKLEANNPFSDKNASQIEANIQRIENAIQSQTDRQGNLSDAYKKAYDAVTAEQEAFIKEQERIEGKAARDKARKIKEEIDKQTKLELELRLKAIVKIQKALEQAQANGIKDSEERLKKLEELRFKNEKELREKQLKEFLANDKASKEQIAAFQKANDDLAKQQLIDHENKMVDIRKQFAIKTIDIQAQTLEGNEKARQEARQKEIDSINEKGKVFLDGLNKQVEVQKAEEQIRAEQQKEREDSNKKLLKDVEENAKKVSAIVVDLFNKQAELAAQRVTDQETNLSRAEARAAQGLETNLAFEKKALAERQAEQVKAAETAKQVARAALLVNLISAAAASGDKNAVATGLKNFGLAIAAEELTKFMDGTEHVGNALGNSNATFKGDDGFLGVANGTPFRFDGTERIVKGSHNKMLGGMSNDAMISNALLGEAMGDYFNPQTPLTTNPYKAQKDSFSKSVSKIESTAVLDELKGIKQQLAKQPNYSAQIVEVQKGLYQWVLREQKQNSAKIKKELIRAMKK